MAEPDRRPIGHAAAIRTECGLRFSVVGPLLASPPKKGELGGELARLSAKVWQHPVTGEPVRFAKSTIERWYYAARNAPDDPVGTLRRRVRQDAGRAPGVSLALAGAIREQYRAHPGWSYQLHVAIFACWCKRSPSWARCHPMPQSGGG